MVTLLRHTRLQLENAYPKLKLPSFPHRIQLLNLDVDGQKRKKALSDYLSFVGSHPQLSSDPTLVSVLHDSVLRIPSPGSKVTNRKSDSNTCLLLLRQASGSLGSAAGECASSNEHRHNEEWYYHANQMIFAPPPIPY